MSCFGKRKLGNWVFLCASTEMKKTQGDKANDRMENKGSQSAANDLVEQTGSTLAVQNTEKNWSLHEGMLPLFFSYKAVGSKEGFFFFGMI